MKKHYHLEDSSWETEHDIEAETLLDALLQFLFGDVNPDSPIAELTLESSLPDRRHGSEPVSTVRELTEAFLDGKCDFEFWASQWQTMTRRARLPGCASLGGSHMEWKPDCDACYQIWVGNIQPNIPA